MAFSDGGRINWGCLASALIGAVTLPTVFGGLMFGGGGCEGRPSSCMPDYTHLWVVMGFSVVGLAALVRLIDRAIAALIDFWIRRSMPKHRVVGAHRQ